MPDNLSSDQHQFIEKACQIADRFNEYQVDEEALTSQLDWEADKFSRIRNELEDAGYITRRVLIRLRRQVFFGSSQPVLNCVRSHWEAVTSFR